MLGALDSQSLGPGLMPETEVCLFILSSSPESPKSAFGGYPLHISVRGHGGVEGANLQLIKRSIKIAFPKCREM